MNNEIEAQVFLKQVESCVKNSSSEWRYNNLLKEQTFSIKTPPDLKYQRVMDFEPWFLVYAHD